jgi:hypothetical protein
MKTSPFNFKRFGLLFRRYFISLRSNELISWGAVIISFAILRNSPTALCLFFLLTSVLYAARFFREIHSQSCGATFLMLPATPLEKLLMGIVMTTVYYFVMMMISYVIGNWLGTMIYNFLSDFPLLKSGNIEWAELFSRQPLRWTLFEVHEQTTTQLGNTVSIRFSAFEAILQLFATLQSMYLLGSIYFKNNQGIKTFFVTNFIQVCLAFFFIFELLIVSVAGDVVFRPLPEETYLEVRHVLLRGMGWMCCLLPPIFWVTAYFRLTEKEL